MIYTQKPVYVVDENPDDKPGCFMNGISFLIPIVGIILYFVKKGEKPKSAKSYLRWAMGGIGVGIASSICSGL